MTPLVFEVPPDATINTIADIMARGRIHRVFVSHAGKIQGVVSALDLVRVLRDMTDPDKG
jgi:CBS domain-containing protein